MRILQLTVHFPPNVGGVETHLDDLVSGFVQKGNNVFVLTYRPLMTKAPWKFLVKKHNLTILRLPWLPGFFYNFVRHPAIEFLYLVPGLFVVTPIVMVLGKIKIVHAHGLIAGFVGVFWSKVLNKRIVVSTHSIYGFPKAGAYHSFVRWIFNNADSVLCLSDQSVEEIRKLGVRKNKVGRFTYWIDSKVFFPIDKKKAKKKLGWYNKFVILFIGRLVEEKGVKILLETAKKLPKDIQVVIIGDGPLREDIEKEAKNVSNVNFIGKVENSKLVNYYNGADVVIVPSTNEEGFGRVIIESLSCGTPVIGANSGGIPEAMNNDVGRLIDITPINIVKTITNLKKSKIVYERLSKNAKKLAVDRYSEKNIDKIISFYK